MQFFNRLVGKKIILHGTGKAAEAVFNKLTIKIDYCLDNDSKKWDGQFLSLKIKNPDVLLEEKKGNVYILVASMYYGEISEQLKCMGFEEFIDFYNGLDLFVNPLQMEVSMIIEQAGAGFYTKVNNLINYGLTEDAIELLDEYERMAPFDQRISYLRALADLKDNKLTDLQLFLTEKIEDSDLNTELNKGINIAFEAERSKDYLQALEICEGLLLNATTNKYKKDILEQIDRIEVNYLEEIREQLTRLGKPTENKNGKFHLHIMVNHFHSKGFFEFIRNYFNISDHVFLVYKADGAEDYFYDVNGSFLHKVTIMPNNHEEIAYFTQTFIKDSKQIFIHYLYDFFCWLICRCDIKRDLNWVLWGGDFYTYIEQNLYDKFTDELMIRLGYGFKTKGETGLKEILAKRYRKSAIRRMSNIVAWSEYDYEKVLYHYITNAGYKNIFYRTLLDLKHLDKPVAISNVKYDFKKNYSKVILLGNSSDPCNNHLDILVKLGNAALDDYCVVAPLSYAGPDNYTRELIIEGKKLLGERFIPITEFLSPVDYAGILSQVDVAVMNHNRQQAGSNVAMLLYMGKKVYLKADGVIYKTFKDMGIVLFDIDSFWISNDSGFAELSENDKNVNKRKIEEHLDLERARHNFEVAML